ncbi:Uncharacterized SAM-binding protein YcdF, DUF218 family [Bradyrhizobium sp. Ghvi]|uniref:YdcF family protein n=1 Tax=Bradyrhizobium sp. Ghvi TaxID=1855319 RepID=UPI0008F175F0|nr:YdcF family protein [Bradyrhizobium sp. Ghvi]SFP70422.1 Uncharacterized SAM-binding protein YcdF, DUF218 family [Bradyrhizobium sp. Ghvi]
MFSTLSKISRLLLEPAAFLVICSVAGLVLIHSGVLETGKAVATVGLLGLVGFGFGPLTSIAVWMLENRFPQVTEINGRVDGIVVLGGGERLTRGQLVVGSAARLLTAVDIARRYPAAQLLFSGGVANSFGTKDTQEASIARHVLVLLGLDVKRVQIEDCARNTRESAVYIAERYPLPKSERWLLITSAVHMPRAIGAFRAMGIDVIPYPVDYSLAADFRPFDLRRGVGAWLVLAEGAAREWMGLIVYRLAGYTSKVLPGPLDPKVGECRA